jgi:hypothetical protein
MTKSLSAYPYLERFDYIDWRTPDGGLDAPFHNGWQSFRTRKIRNWKRKLFTPMISRAPIRCW